MDEIMLVTNEREADHQVPTQATPKMPTVGEFKEIVMRHCRNWDVTSVDSLCQMQTQDLIDELTQHF
jgi:hypothetical protein